MVISEQERDLEKINSSLKDQLKEIQERLDGKADIHKQHTEEVTLEQADMSQQFVELQSDMISSNTALQNLDVHEKKMAELLANCKGI